MKKPNFFIIGAPKCGTTSWATWLSQHPEVFFSRYKEPHFFNADEPNYHFVSSIAEYESLFRDANESHKAIGEGSTWYLHSKVAVNNILSYSNYSKFIICIRNPVEMAYSLHAENVWNGRDQIQDFRKAWKLQSQRAQNLYITKWAKVSSHLVYGEACKIGEQIKRVVKIVRPENIHFIVLDDTKKNPREEYCKVLDFLGISNYEFNDFSPKNTSKTLRSPMLMKTMRLVGSVKTRFGIRNGFGLANFMMKFSRSGPPRKPLSEEMKIELKQYFKEDVYLLSRTIDRDLMYWIET